MDLRELLLWIHIAGVAAWLGANFVQIAVARRFDDPAVAKAWTDTTIWLGERYYIAAGAVIALSGLALVIFEEPFGFGDGFVWIGLVVVLVGAVMGGAVFGPLARKRSAALAAGDAAGAEQALSSTLTAAYVDTLLVVVTILAMVMKWFA